MTKRLGTMVAAGALAAAGLLGSTTGPAFANTQCTYTQGYYKTHLTDFSSPDLTPSLTAGILSVTGLSSISAVYNTPPQGNANIIAADQLITAALNGAPGETGFTGDVGTAFYQLAGYFTGSVTLTRAQVISYANTLDQYNNGLLGVPHCAS